MPERIPLRARDGSVRTHALVDPEDFERFGHLRWSLSTGGYVVRKLPRPSGGGIVFLHREILGLVTGDGLQGEHENRNGVDCQRSNLRISTQRENMQNLSPQGKGRSGLRGVCWHPRAGRWQAYAMLDRKQIHLGLHDTAELAAEAAAAFRRQNMPYSEEAAAA